MNTFMLLYLVVLWIKKTFYSLPKLLKFAKVFEILLLPQILVF